jgi:hypothetical protein
VKAGRPASVSILAALSMALGAVVAQAQAPAQSEAARILLDEARQAAGIGDWVGASAYLAEAAALDPGDADVLYLSALAAVKRDLPLGEALGWLDAALETGRFAYYGRRDASTLKAELLVRERRWKEALKALGPPGPEAAADPALCLIRARARLGLGDAPAFLSELSFALRRFPDDSAFARLFLERGAKLPISEPARGLGDLILSRLTRYSLTDPELPVLAAPLMRDIADRRDAVLAFRAAGGSSAAATLRALEYGIIDESAAASELLSGSYRVLLGDIGSLLNLAGSPAGRAAVHAALSSWSGRVDVDSDGDGIVDGSFSLDKGLATGWDRDSKQEGLADSRILFSDGLPIRATLLRGGLEIDVTYSVYPASGSVGFAEKGETRHYFFAPEAFSFAPIEMRVIVGEGRTALLFPYTNPAQDPRERACASVALSVVSEKGPSRSVTILENGYPLSSTAYEGDRIVSTTAYSKGRPILDRIDADGDGRFESERSYSTDDGGASRASWLRSDVDGDGVYEYREQAVFPFRKEWDYDGDGSVDALQFQLPDGSIEQEFSSRLDGRLDERVVVKAGKIVALSREGSPLSLIPDANPLLTWIGAKSFDLGSSLPEGEGIFQAKGKRYKLVRVAGFAFAELIP